MNWSSSQMWEKILSGKVIFWLFIYWVRHTYKHHIVWMFTVLRKRFKVCVFEYAAIIRYCTVVPQRTLRLQCAPIVKQSESWRTEHDPAALSFVIKGKLPHSLKSRLYPQSMPRMCATLHTSRTIIGATRHTSHGTLMVLWSLACTLGDPLVPIRTMANTFRSPYLSLSLIPYDDAVY